MRFRLPDCYVGLLHYDHTSKCLAAFPFNADAPLHSDLIRQGFVDFLKQRLPGPLFYDPSSGRDRGDGRGKKRVLPESLANRLAHWVRNEVGVTDPRVRPNHGWRHWFVNQCRRYGVDKEARYFMAHGGRWQIGRRQYLW